MGGTPARGWYMRWNITLRIMNNPTSTPQTMVLVTKEVTNAERLDPVLCPLPGALPESDGSDMLLK